MIGKDTIERDIFEIQRILKKIISVPSVEKSKEKLKKSILNNGK